MWPTDICIHIRGDVIYILDHLLEAHFLIIWVAEKEKSHLLNFWLNFEALIGSHYLTINGALAIVLPDMVLCLTMLD